ncbi:putative ApbE family protein [Octadecabacter antarcticus 307]|uniref:Putative ApbE family protein n=1 Tax=Octadecabacter antarcticus 307 TaxID=391626 RepID=M9RDN8_9RHOB|nr:UPF0280 family protein [Octadecabacter antarcticus]AGI67920.1 putative ApbE family protein [Octadecabacter antarcticus 307]
MEARADILPCGTRLHLQHGPIDLIVGADGDRLSAFTLAKNRFATVLSEIVPELSELQLPLTQDVLAPSGDIACRMDHAVRPFSEGAFVTRMAAVAGSVADAVLMAMCTASLSRAYVNNGGDIALHLTEGQSFTLAMAGHDGADLGRVSIHHHDQMRGIATSGRHGRSFSLGIADSVTVLAANAAQADVAATLIANAVDLPQHAAIIRKPAHVLDDTSDLGELPVVVACGPLSQREIADALSKGRARTNAYIDQNLISGAALFLQGQSETTCPKQLSITLRILNYA